MEMASVLYMGWGGNGCRCSFPLFVDPCHYQQYLLMLMLFVFDQDTANDNANTTSTSSASGMREASACPSCGMAKPWTCEGEGRIIGGMGIFVDWWPIKAYRPCPELEAAGRKYQR